MLQVSNSFKEKMATYGKQIDVLLEFDDITLNRNRVIKADRTIDGEMFTSIMRMLELEVDKDLDVSSDELLTVEDLENMTVEKIHNTLVKYLLDLPVDSKKLSEATTINVKLGVKLPEDANYEYVDWGEFVVYDCEDSVDTNSYKLTLYDHLIDTHIKYDDDPLSLNYLSDTVTVGDLFQAICTKFGFTNTTPTFTNSAKIIHEDKYAGLGVTYRDILDEIAGVAGGFIKIFNKNICVFYPTETGEVVGEDELKKLKIGKKVGPFNTVVLARSPQEDNIYYPTGIAPNNRVAIRIDNNQIMDKNRSEFIADLYNRINGLYYYTFEYECFGFGYFEFGDIVTLVDLNGKEYKTIMMNIVDNIDAGITGKAYSEETQFSETKYEYASGVEKRLKNTEIICDKQNNQIRLLAEEQDAQGKEISSIHIDINSITNTVSNIKTITNDNLVYDSVGSLDVSSPTGFGNVTIWHNAATSLQTDYQAARKSISKRSIVIGNDVTYTGTGSSERYAYTPRFELTGGETYSISGWIYVSSSAHSMNLYILASNTKSCEYPKEFKDADYTYAYKIYRSEEDSNYTKGSWRYFQKTITVDNDTISGFIRLGHNGTLSGESLVYLSDLMVVKGKTPVTWQASSKDSPTVTEMTTQIKQTADAINLTVATKVGNDEIISKINQTSEQITIDASKINLNGAVTANNYFKINLDGSMEATSGKIANINISSNGLYYSGTSSTDGFGLWKNGVHSYDGTYIIFHAGGNIANIGSAPFKILQDGSIESSKGTIGGFTITSDSLDSSTTGMSNGHQYAFYVKSGNTTPYYVTMSGGINCQSIVVNGYPLTRTSADAGKQIVTNYIDGNQLIVTTINSLYIFLPDSVSSDKKLKKNIKKTKIDALNTIKNISFKEFDWKGTGKHEELGIIADEIEQINNELVSDVEIEGKTTKVFNQGKMILLNSKAIQEMYVELQEIKEIIKGGKQ